MDTPAAPPAGYQIDPQPPPTSYQSGSNAEVPDVKSEDVAPPPAGYKLNGSRMSRTEADSYMDDVTTLGMGKYKPRQQPKFSDVALVDPEALEHGGPIKSSVHPDTRGGRNLVPVQDVAATRQQLQYQAANPDEMSQVQRSQQMDTSLPLADRLRARSGLEVRKRTELGQRVSDINDRYLDYVGNKGADAGESFANFVGRNFQDDGKASPGEIGLARSVGKNITRTIADPVSSATVLTAGMGGKVGQVALSSLFAAGAAKGSYDAAGQLGSIWNREDVSPQQKAEMASDLFINTAMAGLAGAHAVKVPFLKIGDPLLSSIPQQYRDAVAQKVNAAINKTGGILTRTAGAIGDVAAEVGNSDRENVPTQGVSILRRSLPKVPQQSAEMALPLIRAAANDAGHKSVRASDLLDSPADKDGNTSLGLIGQAKNEVLAQASAAAGPGRTIADMTPAQLKPYREMFNALDDLHDHIEAAQEKETAELKKAAEKGKIPATKAAALVRMGMGAGKVSVSAAAGPALGRMSRILLHAYGIPSGFSDLVAGVKGLIGAGGKLSPTLDDNLSAALGRTLPGPDSMLGVNGETRQPATPYQGDLSVQHETNIAPPRHAHGDATLSPDEEYRPLEPTREQYQPYGGDRSVQHETVIAPPETPHGFARMAPDEPNPRFQLSASSTAAQPQARSASPVEQRPLPPDNGIGSSTAFPATVTPERVPSQISMGGSSPSLSLAGSATVARQPQTQSISDLLSKPIEIPRSQPVSAHNPGDVIVPRGQHPENIVQNALMKLGLPALREAARAGDIDYLASDTHQDLIEKIMDAYAGQDEHLANLAETLQGQRGPVPAGRREKAPPDETDLTGVLGESIQQANAKSKPEAAPVHFSSVRDDGPRISSAPKIGDQWPEDNRRKAENENFRESLKTMTPADKDAALLEYHERERTSNKTGLPNDIAFEESAKTLGQSHPYIGFADADDFKTINDTFGHEFVDQKVLQPIGDLLKGAIAQENGIIHAFHISGDEFTFRASDPDVVERVVNHVNDQMGRAVFVLEKPDGNIIRREGVGLSHGTGSTQKDAERAAMENKAARKAAGLRTGARDAEPGDTAQDQNSPTGGHAGGDENSERDTPQRQGLLSRASDLKPNDYGVVPTNDLSTDPSRFQYKGGTDEQGVTNALKEQKTYDQNKGGLLLVWKDPANQKVYVVNGHHRYELAQRAGEKNVLVRMIDAPDAETAKVVGAETNISEGHGSTVDAARFFKAAKISTPQQAVARNLPMGQAKVTDGLAMARLDNSILDKVESGDIPEGRAVAIGKVTDSPAQQDATLKAIAKREARTGKTLTVGEAESIARQVRDADTHIEQGADLFGAFNREQSLFGEQAEIDDYILKQLRTDKRTFGAVSSKSRAEALSKVKNQSINAEENQRISAQASQAETLYTKLVNRAGALNDIRNNAAKELAQRYSKPNEVKAKAYERVRQEIQAQIGGGSATGTEGKK